MAPNQQEQAFELAKDLLKSWNKVLFGSTADHLVAILESTNISLSLGKKLTEFLDWLNTNLHTIFWVWSLSTLYNINELEKYQKIEDKVAYLVSLLFSSAPGWSALTLADKTTIQTKIWVILEKIDNHFSQDEKINESDVVVMSALSNFKISIDWDEKKELEEISKKIKKLLKDTDFEHAFWEISEEPVQRIQKLKTIIALLEQKWLINSDTSQAVSDFKTKFVPKLKELNEFNEEYFKLDNARTIFYKVDTKYGKVNILSTKEQAKLEEVMKDLGVEDIEAYVTTLYWQLWAGESREAKDKILDRGLWALKKNSKFRKTIREKKIKQPDLEKMYLSYFSLQLIERAREWFHSKKNTVFWDNESNFDETITNWRKLKRDKIIDLWWNMDIVWLQSIFNNDSKVFYELTEDDWNNQNIKDALKEVINTQYSSLLPKEKESLANHILARNNANIQLYYGKINEPEESKLRRQEMTLSALSMAWKTGSFINNKLIAPSLKGVVKASELTVSTLIWKGIFGTIAKTSVWVENILKNTNAKITKKPKTWRGKLLKSPVLLALPVTKMLELWWRASNFSWWKIKEWLKMANDWINNKVKSWSNNELDTWLQWIVVWGISKGVLWLWVWNLYDKQVVQKFEEKMSREEKEQVVSDFYTNLSNWKTSSEVSKILQGLDVAQKVNDSQPYIFDKVEEGVKVVDETKEEKEKLSKDTLEKMLEQITKIKWNITLEKDSQNKYIAEVMKQLEKKFGELENIINGKWKFEDKLEKIKWIFNKIVSDLWDWVLSWTPLSWSWEVSKIKMNINKNIFEKAKNEARITELQNDLTTVWSAPNVKPENLINTQNNIKSQIESYNTKNDKLDEDNSVLEEAKDRLEKLVKTWTANKFSEIIKWISDDSSTKKVLKKLKDEYEKKGSNFIISDYKTQHDSLISELSQIDIS